MKNSYIFIIKQKIKCMKTKKRRAKRVGETNATTKVIKPPIPKIGVDGQSNTLYSFEDFTINTHILIDLLYTENSSFFGFVMSLCLNMERHTNKLYTKKTPIRLLVEKYGVSTNIVKLYVNHLIKLDIIRLDGEVGDEWYIFNPFLATKGIVSNYTISLFSNSIYSSEAATYSLKNQKLKSTDVPINTTHNIYVLEHKIETGDTFYKIGYSGNIKKRFSNYTAYNPTIKLIYSFYNEFAKKLESTIHSKYKSVYKNEWYDSSTMNTIINDYKLNLTITQ